MEEFGFEYDKPINESQNFNELNGTPLMEYVMAHVLHLYILARKNFG